MSGDTTSGSLMTAHLLVAVGDVADLVPGEGALGCQLIVGLIDVQAQGVHAKEEIRSLFVLIKYKIKLKKHS